MGLQLNRNSLQTGQYAASGLNAEFLDEMVKVISALQEAGYEPFDQLTGYIRTGNMCYITRHGGARDRIEKMDTAQLRIFLKYYKKHR